MKPKMNSEANKAYEKGKKAKQDGLSESQCPYLLGRVQYLKSWWLVGYREF